LNAHYPDISYLSQLAFRAGALMRRNLRAGMPYEVKGDGSPVTETDNAINRIVLESVSRDFPHIRVIAEEGCYEVEGAEYTLLSDPLDGTIPFRHGLPISTFVAALLRGTTPLLAVIYDPFMERMWSATAGGGTFLNGAATRHRKRVRVNDRNTLRGASVAVFGWKSDPFNMNAARGKLEDAGAIVGNPQSVAILGGLLASGVYDAIVFPGRHGWETAAMHLIAEEAGGKVTDIHGGTMCYGPNCEINGHIITNGRIHDEIVQIVASCQRVEVSGN